MPDPRSVVTLVLLLCVSASARPPQARPLEELFSRVDPAVVTIRTTSTQVGEQSPLHMTSVEGLGSGVLLEGGLVMTAAHVVQTADEVIVEFHDDSRVKAHVVAAEPRADVALLRLDGAHGSRVKPARLGDSDKVRVGARVIVVGAPMGMTHTLTVGYLSARRSAESPLEGLVALEFLQTDAAINKGNSGGPMFNLNGEVIGIVSHILSFSGGSQGMGFAVTSNIARRLLIDEHSFWSGLDGVLISGMVAQALNLPTGTNGYLVQRVARGSPADKLGIKPGRLQAKIQGQDVLLGGDVVVQVLGITVDREHDEDIRSRINALRAGDTLTVTVLRAGTVHDLSLELTEAMVKPVRP